ncbi:MAG TPA: oxidoreductase [Chloroflexia bacterium]|nr:oxidoreductase [Chloroflexia bacterium]
MPEWTARKIPDQTGRVVIVTGGNSGLGYESALALARKGAEVIVASRNQAKAQNALDRIRQQIPGAKVGFMQLDLASQASVHAFAGNFKAKYNRLDLLFNNAGIATVSRQETEDGFEMHLGVNHLGHFALTGLLLDKLLATPGSRIITTTSVLQTIGWINFEDLQLKRTYTRFFAYGQSKLANMLFALELDRRLKAAGATTLSVAAHPGYSNTNMTQKSASTFGTFLEDILFKFTNEVVAQNAEMGALPQLYAATAPGVKGGELYGPRFFTHGYPAINPATIQAYDEETARKLWQVSEELTRVNYSLTKEPVAV